MNLLVSRAQIIGYRSLLGAVLTVLFMSGLSAADDVPAGHLGANRKAGLEKNGGKALRHPAVVDRAALAARVKEVFRSRCLECHGGSKTEEGIKVLDYDLLVNKRRKIVPGSPDQSELLHLISAADEPMMPPAELPRLSAEDVAAVRQWIATGAAPFPDDVARPAEKETDPTLKDVRGVDYVHSKILAHVRSLPEEDRRFVRYFSIHHLVTGGASRGELDLQRDALVKVVNHLSRERKLVRPRSIDAPLDSVFALDLRSVAWDRRVLQRAIDGAAVTPAPVDLFDLVLLEYPYAAIYEGSPTYDQLATEFIEPSGMVRPVAFVRADWFCSVATLSPLYEDILQLPLQLSELEKLEGVDVGANQKGFISRRAGLNVSGVSQNNRVLERHPTRDGALWISYDFAGNKGRANIFRDPLHLDPNGGEMIFTLPNGLQGYFVATGSGRRLAAAPTSIVTDKFAEDKTVRSALSCIRCHEDGMRGFADAVRPAAVQSLDSAAFDKLSVLALYPPQEEMASLVNGDRERFQAAMQALLGRPQAAEPLTAVSHRFLDAPLQLIAVSAELGLADREGLPHLFRAPQFAGLGLLPLASGGVVRRDMWEDYYDLVVRGLGLGVPVVPLDGLTRQDYPAAAAACDVELATSKKILAPGDEVSFLVTNRSPHDVHIELIGTGTQGEKQILVPASTLVKPGETFRFPEKGSIKIQPAVGKETLTLFACPTAFPPGEVLRGDRVADRVLHAFYPLRRGDGRPSAGFDPSRMVKKTLDIETK